MYPAHQSFQESIESEAEIELKFIVSALNDAFTKLLKRLKEELKDTDVSEIREHLHDSGYTYLPLEESEKCKDFKELLRKLEKHYDFLDCDVLTTLAKEFATPTLSQKFQDHSEAALRFCESHTVQELQECLQEIFSPCVKNLANAPKAHIRLHNDWNKLAINKLFILIRHFFPTSNYMALTKVVNIMCDSVHISITYFMTESHDEIEEIILYSKERLAIIKFIGVYGMIVNNEIILSSNDESFTFDTEVEKSYIKS